MADANPNPDARALPHRRTPVPLHFPAAAEMPETLLHMLLRSLVFELLRHHFGARAAVGSEQFVYFDAADPKRCVAPDAFVKLVVAPWHFAVWKTWESGTPELCIEIASASETQTLESKLAAYHALGVREVVRFDPERPVGKRLRAWDRIDDDLVERVVPSDATPCVTLGAHFVVRPGKDLEAALRFADDAAGARLWPTAEEAAERRVAELEAELRRRGI